ncbi:hypothetical protein V5E97_10705 [Singulisphaera sp. Ch08]|uniref:Uncharacterized protein n=1 Tax=Singulisphaera sp. Ch08 TaxID=3120278 RepID=A0AAU7CN04_9BACT
MRTAHVRLAIRTSGCIAWCLALSVAAHYARANDDQPREGRRGGGELIVRASEMSPGNPDRRFMGMVAIDPRTARWRTLYEGPEFGPLSPDSRYMLVSQFHPDLAEKKDGIWVYDLKGEKPPRRVFPRKGYPLWSHDGDKLVIAAEVSEKPDGGKNVSKFETWLIDADGTGRTRLPIPDEDYVLDCSRDDAWLATRTLGEGSDHWGRLTLVHPDGTGSRTLTEGSAKQNLFSIFKISPDSRSVAYVEVRVEKGVRKSRLFVVDIEGKHRRELPVNFESDTSALLCWSLDGSDLALGLINHATKEGSIGLVDLAVGDFRKLTLPPGRWNLHLYDWR